MEQAVARHRISPGIGSTTLEVGQPSARLLDENQWRGEIPGVELRFDHGLTRVNDLEDVYVFRSKEVASLFWTRNRAEISG